MSEDAPCCLQAVISGRVQGVWFRAWTEREALARGLGGWVRNRRDGTVEAVFAGPAAAVAEMLEACRKGGPPLAQVDEVVASPWDGEAPADFQQKPTV